MESADQAIIDKLFVVALDPDGPEPHRTPEHSDEDEAQSQNKSSSTANAFEHSGRQTGPKGVMADYNHSKRIERQQGLEDMKAHNEEMLRQAPTTTTYRQDLALQKQAKRQAQDRSSDELELESDQEDEVLRKYRAQRLQEMKKFSANGRASKRPTYGKVMEVNAEQYVAMTETADASPLGTMVIVHIYDSDHNECRQLNQILVPLAAKYAHAKFLRLQAHLAFPDNEDDFESKDGGFDYLALPTVLAHRAPEGHLVSNLVRFTDDVLQEEEEMTNGRKERGAAAFSLAAVEAVLLKTGSLRKEDAVNIEYTPEKSDSDYDSEE